MADGIDRDWLEGRARAVLETVPDWIWDGESLPVPVEDIVDSCFGLHVCEVENMHAAPNCPPLGPDQSLSGLLLADTKQIWCNAIEARKWPPRRRFTIGHELGHWVLHRTGQDSLFCRRAAVAEDPGDPAVERPQTPTIEREANAFAAALLMPADLIEHHYFECRNRDDRFEELCKRFGASGAAMSRRLKTVI